MIADKCKFSEGDPALFDGLGVVVISAAFARYGGRGEFQGYMLMVRSARGHFEWIQWCVMDHELTEVG